MDIVNEIVEVVQLDSLHAVSTGAKYFAYSGYELSRIHSGFHLSIGRYLGTDLLQAPGPTSSRSIPWRLPSSDLESEGDQYLGGN